MRLAGMEGRPAEPLAPLGPWPAHSFTAAEKRVPSKALTRLAPFKSAPVMVAVLVAKSTFTESTPSRFSSADRTWGGQPKPHVMPLMARVTGAEAAVWDPSEDWQATRGRLMAARMARSKCFMGGDRVGGQRIAVAPRARNSTS